jgi:hypothetical protein
MDYTAEHITQASEAVHWEDLDIEMYHKYNEGTEEFLQWLGE